MSNGEIKYDIKEKIAVINQNQSGWKKELNIVSWNGGAAKYDIRDWSEDHEHMSRGLTLTENEMKILVKALRERGLAIDKAIKNREMER